MKKTCILLVLVCFNAGLYAQYITPWGISPLAVPVNQQTAATQVNTFSLGNMIPTLSNSNFISIGLQQTGLDAYISVWDTLDISELREQSVYDNSPVNYFLKSEVLGPDVQFVIQADRNTMGEYIWDPTLCLFTFIPDLGNAEFCDTVMFVAFTETDTIRTQIHFTYLPQLPSEENAMGLKKVSSQDNSLMNNVVSAFDNTDSTLHIAGRILLFDAEFDDYGICEYSAQGDADSRYDSILHINLYADSVVIHEALRFPGCDVTIYARKLVFDNYLGSINTSQYGYAMPNTTQGLTSVDGKGAGNIFLYTGDIQMGPGVHFILDGSAGQPVSAETIPFIEAGDGGDGGLLQSPVHISSANYSLLPGAAGDNGENNTCGVKGYYAKIDWNPTIWIHARNIQPEMDYLRLQYMENNLDYVRTRTASLNSLLSMKYAVGDPALNTDDADLMNAHNEIRELQNRINKKLDYYGNPVGWVPLLSFEVYKGVFESEVDNAFNLMFLSYLINKSDANIVQVTTGMKNARTSMIDEVDALQLNLTQNISNLVTYENIYDLLKLEVDSLFVELKDMEKRLLEEAEENAEKAKKIAVFQSIASVGGSILSSLPIPACQIVGQGLTVVSELNLEDPFSLENVSALIGASADAYSGYKDYKQEAIDKFGTDAKLKELTSISQDEIDNIDSGLNKWNTMNNAASGLVSYASNYDASTSILSVSDEAVQAELDKLKAASSEYINLMSRIEARVKEKKQMHEKIAYTMNCISRDMNRVAENRMAIQSLTQSIQDESGKRDIRTMQYANGIEKRAFERLQKYHYLMTRAFEYRTLMPWSDPLDLESIRTGMFNYVKELSDTATNVVVPKEQFDAIKGIYLDQLHEVADSILSIFEEGGFTRNQTTSFELSKEDLELLNKGDEFFINPYKRNLFGLDKENVRILNLGVVKCILEDGTELIGTLDDSGLKSDGSKDSPFEIIFEHTGYSKLQSNGKIYYFNHNRIGSSKFEWRSNIDIIGNKITQDRISNSDKSLLHSLVDNLSDSQLTFCSEPSAWADISMIRSSGSETRKIVSLVMEINFDYKTLSEDIFMLKIETDGDVSPYFLISTEDINGLKDGKGDFYRTYYEATSIAITAQKQYGNQKFIRWDEVSLTGIGGRSILTSSPTAGIMTTEHTHLIAVYESMDSVWIKTPDGSLPLNAGDIIPITWDQNVDHDMKIDLYLDGFYLTSICDSIMGKLFNWQVPLDLDIPESEEGKLQIKISSRLDNSIFDLSNNLLLVSTDIPGLFSDKDALKMLLHPNPAKDAIRISLEGLDNPQEVPWSIYSIDGKMIKRGTLYFENGQDEKTLILDSFKRGVFIMNVDVNNRQYSRKFILE